MRFAGEISVWQALDAGAIEYFMQQILQRKNDYFDKTYTLLSLFIIIFLDLVF